MRSTKPILSALGCRLLLLSLILAGCSSPDSGPPRLTVQERVFARPYAEVWETVGERFRELEMDEFHKFRGVALTEFVPCTEAIDQYALEPEVFRAKWTDARVQSRVEVRKVTDDSTAVRISCYFVRYNPNSSRRWHRWPSKGVKEEELMNALASALEQDHASR